MGWSMCRSDLNVRRGVLCDILYIIFLLGKGFKFYVLEKNEYY